MKTFLGVMLAGVAGMAAASSAYAASQEFCNGYAEDAVSQQGRNAANQCGFTGPRWHENFQLHYAWCLNSNEDLANSETEARSTSLSECAGGEEIEDDEELGDEDELDDEALGDDEELEDEDDLDDEGEPEDEDEPNDEGGSNG